MPSLTVDLPSQRGGWMGGGGGLAGGLHFLARSLLTVADRFKRISLSVEPGGGN